MRKGSQQNGLKKTVEKSKVEFFHDDPEGEISHHNTPVAVNNINWLMTEEYIWNTKKIKKVISYALVYFTY